MRTIGAYENGFCAHIADLRLALLLIDEIQPVRPIREIEITKSSMPQRFHFSLGLKFLSKVHLVEIITLIP